MTRTDFYILDRTTVEAKLVFACRLAEKAVGEQHMVLINTESEADSARLDDLLWTFSQGSFLPHRRLATPAAAEDSEPILIGAGGEPPPDLDLLINLAPTVPDFVDKFERIAELVGGDDADKAAGRARFRYYRDQGYDLRTHHI